MPYLCWGLCLVWDQQGLQGGGATDGKYIRQPSGRRIVYYVYVLCLYYVFVYVCGPKQSDPNPTNGLEQQLQSASKNIPGHWRTPGTHKRAFFRGSGG